MKYIIYIIKIIFNLFIKQKLFFFENIKININFKKLIK